MGVGVCVSWVSWALRKGQLPILAHGERMRLGVLYRLKSTWLPIYMKSVAYALEVGVELFFFF